MSQNIIRPGQMGKVLKELLRREPLEEPVGEVLKELLRREPLEEPVGEVLKELLREPLKRLLRDAISEGDMFQAEHPFERQIQQILKFERQLNKENKKNEFYIIDEGFLMPFIEAVKLLLKELLRPEEVLELHNNALDKGKYLYANLGYKYLTIKAYKGDLDDYIKNKFYNEYSLNIKQKFLSNVPSSLSAQAGELIEQFDKLIKEKSTEYIQKAINYWTSGDISNAMRTFIFINDFINPTKFFQYTGPEIHETCIKQSSPCFLREKDIKIVIDLIFQYLINQDEITKFFKNQTYELKIKALKILITEQYASFMDFLETFYYVTNKVLKETLKYVLPSIGEVINREKIIPKIINQYKLDFFSFNEIEEYQNMGKEYIKVVRDKEGRVVDSSINSSSLVKTKIGFLMGKIKSIPIENTKLLLEIDQMLTEAHGGSSNIEGTYKKADTAKECNIKSNFKILLDHILTTSDTEEDRKKTQDMLPKYKSLLKKRITDYEIDTFKRAEELVKTSHITIEEKYSKIVEQSRDIYENISKDTKSYLKINYPSDLVNYLENIIKGESLSKSIQGDDLLCINKFLDIIKKDYVNFISKLLFDEFLNYLKQTLQNQKNLLVACLQDSFVYSQRILLGRETASDEYWQYLKELSTKHPLASFCVCVSQPKDFIKCQKYLLHNIEEYENEIYELFEENRIVFPIIKEDGKTLAECIFSSNLTA